MYSAIHEKYMMQCLVVSDTMLHLVCLYTSDKNCNNLWMYTGPVLAYVRPHAMIIGGPILI